MWFFMRGKPPPQDLATLEDICPLLRNTQGQPNSEIVYDDQRLILKKKNVPMHFRRSGLETP